MKLRNIMTTELITVDPETTLQEVASLLVSEHIGGVPVVSGSRLVGVVSATDILEFEASNPGAPRERSTGSSFEEDLGSVEEWGTENEPPASYFADMWEDAGAGVVERIGVTDRPEWNVLEEYKAAEVMTRTIFSLPPEADVQDAAGRMIEADVHRVLVMKDGELVGVVTTRDVLRAVAEHGLGGD